MRTADRYYKQLRNRGFITFTILGTEENEMLVLCAEKKTRVRVDHFNGFVTVTVL